jgi:putative hydrolase of HD superfamily
LIRKALLLKIFDGSYMQRWNDKVRPVDFVELDKQAHKMIIAYFLGKFEEGTPGFSWMEVMEGGIFELLQRLVITDLKPPIFYRIREDAAKYRLLNEWVYGEIEPFISPLGQEFCRRFKRYFTDTEDTLNKKLLGAAHFYATKWEFDILERTNPGGYEMGSIRQALEIRQEYYSDLEGMAALATHEKYRNFIDLCGQLRFQTRWANRYRIPRTSVIGHSLFVAVLSYLFSLEIGACESRLFNNYFTGLFHDLPEVLTRDIISPVKRSIEGLSDLIKEYEKEQMEKEIYSLIPVGWHEDIRLFTEHEFDSIIVSGGGTVRLTSDDINARYNRNEFMPRDGELVKAADVLAAFIEAFVAIKNGSPSQEFQEAKSSFRSAYGKAVIAGINFGEIYADFD